METIKSFLPIIDKNSKVLVLGSMPSVTSLEKMQYYGHKRNAFWRIIFDVFNYEYSDDYNVKKQTALDNKIAIWDVIASCQRQGSLDSNIKNEVVNDFEKLVFKYNNIKCICFNGTKAYDVYKKRVGIDNNMKYIKLPSTSPAHAISYQKKLDAWKIIKELCADNVVD